MTNKMINNPAGAFGYTDFQNQMPSWPGEFLTNAAITAPVVVAVDTTGKVGTAPTNGTAALCVGVAVESVGSGVAVQVVCLGIGENLVADGAIAAGALLKRSANTAGAVAATATPAPGEVIGFAINASAGGTVDMWVTKGT